jgi:hypothetical protein
MIKRYPAIELAARHGRKIALIIGVLAALASIASFLANGSAGRLAWGLILSGGLFVALRIGAEMIEVIADTLLPR